MGQVPKGARRKLQVDDSISTDTATEARLQALETTTFKSLYEKMPQKDKRTVLGQMRAAQPTRSNPDESKTVTLDTLAEVLEGAGAINKRTKKHSKNTVKSASIMLKSLLKEKSKKPTLLTPDLVKKIVKSEIKGCEPRQMPAASVDTETLLAAQKELDGKLAQVDIELKKLGRMQKELNEIKFSQKTEKKQVEERLNGLHNANMQAEQKITCMEGMIKFLTTQVQSAVQTALSSSSSSDSTIKKDDLILFANLMKNK